MEDSLYPVIVKSLILNRSLNEVLYSANITVIVSFRYGE